MAEPMRRTPIRLTFEQHRALRELAEGRGKSLSAVARELIEAGLKENGVDGDATSGNRRQQTLERLEKARQALLQRRGRPIPGDGLKAVNELREERDAELAGAGDHGARRERRAGSPGSS